jgi:collagen type VII alpha
VASTTHNFKFTLPTTGTPVLSMDFLYCTTASGSCTTPSGLVTTSATLNGAPTNLGSGGTWTATVTTNGRLKIANASNTGAPSANATVNFNSVTNPTLSGNSTVYYVRITSYSDASWTTAIDTGNVANAVTNQIQVTASVNETLDFCAFQTGSTCAGGTGTTVALGTLSSSAASGGTSVIVAGTNASNGYAVQYTGATLTCSGCTGTPTIAATGTTGATSSTGSAQFGINAVNNTSAPVQGANPSGGSGAASTNYAAGNTYSFVASTLTQIASASVASADTVYTISYLANIPANQAAGAYSTTITYICTATF